MFRRRGHLSAVVLLLASGANAAGVSQPLPEVLAEFLDLGVPLIYSAAQISNDMLVEAVPLDAGADLHEQLRTILKPHGLTIKLDQELVFIVSESPALSELRGRIISSITGRQVAAAQIRFADKHSSSDAGGNFRLSLESGSHVLRVSAAGFQPAELTVEVDPSAPGIEQIIRLVPRYVNPGTEIVNVFASRYALALSGGRSQQFDHEALQALPSVGREPLRALARLPGAASTGFSAKTHIRGGEEDETLVLFDGMPLFEPFHLKDFQSLFSLLDSRATERIETYTGGFPADFGDRLSGVLNIDSLDSVTNDPKEIWLDLFHVGGLASGRFDGQGRWLVSARRGNIDLVVDFLDPSLGKPRYQDMFASVGHPLNDAMTISASTLLGSDRVVLTPDEEIAQAEYKTQHYWATLSHELSSSLSYETLLGHARIDNQRVGSIAEEGDTLGSVFDDRRYSISILKQDWAYATAGPLSWRWGAELRDLQADYNYRSAVNYDDPIAAAFDFVERRNSVQLSPGGSQFGAYFSASAKVSESLSSELGVRWDRHTYIPSANKINPRLSFNWRVGERTSLRATWGRYTQAQGIDELQVEDGVSEFFKPQRSDHTIIGLEHHFRTGIDLRIEAYEKALSDLRPRYENLFDTFQLLPELQLDRIEVAPERANAKGVELSLSGAGPRRLTDWWFNINAASVEDRIGGISIPRNWDQRRSFGFGLQWDLDQWDLNLAGRYHSGWPTTRLDFIDDELVIAQRNRSRLPSFKSLDLRLSRQWQFSRGDLTAYLEVTNLTDEKNPCCISYDLEENEQGVEELQRVLEPGLPVTPNIGLLWEF